MSNIDLKIEQIKKRRLGHADIWECSLEEFKVKALPEYLKQQKNNNITNKILKLATSFLRIKFEAKELKGTIEYEVAKSIEESMIYYTNVLGEDD
jgi:hypothetical protein